jgi:hypothetical protein
MSLNDVLQSIKVVIERSSGFAPIVYADGTKGNAAILINFPEAAVYEKEIAFEFCGATAAAAYKLGTLTHLYYAITRTGFPSDNEKKQIELLQIDFLDVVKNAQKIYLFIIQKKNKTITFEPVAFDELHDKWVNQELLPAFVHGYSKNLR